MRKLCVDKWGVGDVLMVEETLAKVERNALLIKRFQDPVL